MILCIHLSLSPCPFPDALSIQPCRLLSVPSCYSFCSWESLILLFIPLEHLHINPFFLSCFAVLLGAQMLSGRVLEMKIRSSSGLCEVLILMQNSQSRAFIFSSTTSLLNANISLSPSDRSATPPPSAALWSCLAHTLLPSPRGLAPACISSEAAWMCLAAHLSIHPCSYTLINIFGSK